jgi:hypothetical protein
MMKAARCPLLGYTPGKLVIEGSTITNWFFEVDQQPEVGLAGYDRGAEILEEFFHRELRQFLVRGLEKVRAVALLFAVAHNLMRAVTLRAAVRWAAG